MIMSIERKFVMLIRQNKRLRWDEAERFQFFPDWEEVKDQIMYDAVLKKFQTHKKLAKLLLSTGTEEIFENAPGDYYWGCGKDGTGLNKLGKILVNVRSQIARCN